jgi:GAF domain-containing protein
VLVGDVTAEPTLSELLDVLRAENISAIAFVPLLHNGQLVGKFMLYYDEPHEFPPAEVSLAEVLAAQVALALARWESETVASRAARRLTILAEVTGGLAQASSMDEVADVVLTTALREVGARSGSLCLIAGDDELEIAYSLGYPDELKQYWGRFPIDGDLPASEAVRLGTSVFITSLEERDARYPVFAGTPVVDDEALAVIPLRVVPLASEKAIGCLVLGFAEPRQFSKDDKDFLFVLSARVAGALERARLADERESARSRLAFLADASAVLTTSLEYESTVAQVVDMAVPYLADGCALYLATGGDTKAIALQHKDPAKVPLLRRLAAEYPPTLLSDHGTGAVIRKGTLEVSYEITEDMLSEAASDAAHLELLRAVGIGSSAVLPLRTRDHTLGALALINDAGRRLDQDTLDLAHELAGRIAVAVDNARLFEDRAYVAHALQQSLLPPELPGIDGIELAARYLPASFDIGGDFYDVFQLPTGPWLVVVGDVCGRGPAAAALTGLIRSALRTAAMKSSDPSEILTVANDAMLSQVDDPKLFTVALATLEPAGASVRLTLSLAGHPAPIVVGADRTARTVGTGGTLLGVFPRPALRNDQVVLGPGEALVFYTDGALGRGDGRDLAARLDGRHSIDAAGLADAVVAEADVNADDDVAVLVIRIPS